MNRATGIRVFFLCLMFPPGICAQQKAAGGDIKQQPPPVARAEQTATHKLEPKISFEERLLATIPAELESPVNAGLFINFTQKGEAHGSDKMQYDYYKVNARPAVLYPSNKERSAPFIVFFSGNPVGRLSLSQTPTTFGAGTQVTSVYSDGRKVFLLLGEQKDREFDAVSVPFSSPDLTAIGYIAAEDTSEGERDFLVVGHKWMQLRDESIRLHQLYNSNELEKWPPFFSPDGKRVVYVTRRLPLKDGKESVALIEGDWNDPSPVPIKKGPEFEYVDEPTFSPDGATLAYRVREGQKWFIVIGEKKGPEYDGVSAPRFSPDSRAVGYSANKGDKEVVVTGEKEGPGFNKVYNPVFSPDGTTFAYHAIQSNKHFVVVSDKKGPQFSEVGTPVFSPDGSVVAYAAAEASKTFVFVGDKRGPEFDYVGDPIFSPDGTTVAYWAGDRKSKKGFVVVGDKKGPGFEAIINDPIFGSDYRTVFYTAKQGKKMFVVSGDTRGPEVDELTPPTLSPDRSTLAYSARRGSKWFVVVGDKKGAEFDWVDSHLYFSADGTKVAYGAERITGHRREYWWKVIDVR
jgi:Tol biopolymer transport system component